MRRPQGCENENDYENEYERDPIPDCVVLVLVIVLVLDLARWRTIRPRAPLRRAYGGQAGRALRRGLETPPYNRQRPVEASGFNHKEHKGAVPVGMLVRAPIGASDASYAL